jgi:CRP-like cAMP-binding protein
MSEIGKLYRAGEVIFRQGDLGSCMYVIQSGKVEVTVHRDETQYCLQTLGEGDFFGEMALFGNQVRSATVRAVSEVYALTLEKKVSCGGCTKIHHWHSIFSRNCAAASPR